MLKFNLILNGISRICYRIKRRSLNIFKNTRMKIYFRFHIFYLHKNYLKTLENICFRMTNMLDD